MKQKVILVGSGISGLSTLYFFLQKHANQISEIKIYEKQDKIGGVLTNTQQNGYLLEHGAQGVLNSREHFNQLIKKLNLADTVLTASPQSSKRAFLFKNKVIFISPKNLKQIFQTKLLTFFGLLRVLCEIFIGKNKNKKNETVSAFFTRRFGHSVAAHFISPVMKGIWGGASNRICLKYAFPTLYHIENTHGSVLKYLLKSRICGCMSSRGSVLSSRGLTAGSSRFSFFKKDQKNKAKKTILSFDCGMHALPTALYGQIEQICVQNNIKLELILNHHQSIQDKYDFLVYSGQPWNDSRLPFQFPKNEMEILKNIPTHSLIVVGIGSHNSDVMTKLDGFGALAVENNPQGVLGVINIHSLYSKHLPKESFLYRVIMGGENLPLNINLKTASDAEIIEIAKDYLQKFNLLNADKKYEFEKVIRHFDYLPLPTDHQEKVIQALQNIENDIPGVFLTGNYILGPSIENCIEQSELTAQKMSDYFLKHQNNN